MWASATVRLDTMAAILHYCVFTKLVCPLPHSCCLTFPPALPHPLGNRGLVAAMVMKEGVQLGGTGGWQLPRKLDLMLPFAALLSILMRNGQNKSVGMTDVGLLLAGWHLFLAVSGKFGETLTSLSNRVCLLQGLLCLKSTSPRGVKARWQYYSCDGYISSIMLDITAATQCSSAIKPIKKSVTH